MYSGNETLNVIRKLNSRGYSVTIENIGETQLVKVMRKSKIIGEFNDDVFGRSSNSIPVYGTGMKNMIDWFYQNEKEI